jgi:hypothetical protein
MGMNTTNQVKVKMAFSSQNAEVRLAAARVQSSVSERSRDASLGGGSCGGGPSGYNPIFSGSRATNAAHETTTETASKPRIK